MSEPGRLEMLTEAARIKTVISGVYEINANHIRISASAVDLQKKTEVTRFEVEGELSEALGVMRKLSTTVRRWIGDGRETTTTGKPTAWFAAAHGTTTPGTADPRVDPPAIRAKATVNSVCVSYCPAEGDNVKQVLRLRNE